MRRNDWRALPVPDPGMWTPTEPVSVVVPAYGAQPQMDTLLASLAAQTYPAHLFEVVVVDDDSRPPLRLPERRPESARLHRLEGGPHGPGFVRQAGSELTAGAVIMFIDVDMVVNAGHLEAHLRWHHLIDHAVTIGAVEYVIGAEPGLTAEQVYCAAVADEVGRLFAERPRSVSQWLGRMLTDTERLAKAGPQAFRGCVTGSCAIGRELFVAAGGFDPGLHLGEDTELGYRLAQRGAVFIPDSHAAAWHLGPSLVMRAADDVWRHNSPYFAQRIPIMTEHRRSPGRVWSVPMMEVVVDATAASPATVRATVDRILASEHRDLCVRVVAPWSALSDTRTRERVDLEPSLRWLREGLRNDARVVLSDDLPESAFPVPFRLELPPDVAVSPGSVGALLRRARDGWLGLVQALVEPVATTSTGAARVVRLTRTAAVERARRLGAGADLDDVVDAVYGSVWVDGQTYGLTLHTETTLADDLHAWTALPRALSDVRLELQQSLEVRTRQRRRIDRLIAHTREQRREIHRLENRPSFTRRVWRRVRRFVNRARPSSSAPSSG